jgi:hypothetical protein
LTNPANGYRPANDQPNRRLELAGSWLGLLKIGSWRGAAINCQQNWLQLSYPRFDPYCEELFIRISNWLNFEELGKNFRRNRIEKLAISPRIPRQIEDYRIL